jgi:UDP:flavonoid glycosyltransferase YjiC (YdhE family)
MPNVSLRILVMPDAISLAHVARALQIARAARRRGHSVHVASAGAYQGLFTEAGFAVESLFSVRREQALAAIRKGKTLYDDETLERYVKSDLEVLDRVRPDVVVGDLRLSLDISAEMTHIPYVAVLNAYWTHFYSAPVSAPRTFPLFRILGTRLATRLMPWVQPIMLRRYAKPFNRYRQKVGLAPRSDLFDVMCSRDLTLLADLPEFAPCANLPDHVCYAGPFLWEPAIEPPAWLDRVDPNQPTAYVTMGSTGTRELFAELLRRLTEAGIQVMATTCNQIDAADIPEGCFTAPMAPASRLLRLAHVTVCHGGNGSIYQSLSRGVPVVGVPTFHDQEFNMDRVEALGVGVRMDERSPGAMAKAVEHVLTHSRFAGRAADLAESIATWDAPTEALWQIERLCAHPSPALIEAPDYEDCAHLSTNSIPSDAHL